MNDKNKQASLEAEQKQLYEKYTKLLLQRYYLYDPNVQEDKKYFTIQGQTIGTSGNFVVFTGLPKVGKSSIIAGMIASAYTKDPVLHMKLHVYKGKNRIAYFDTEQSKFDFNNQLKRISSYTGLTDFKSLDCFLLRDDYTKDILNLIEAYLKKEKNCGILIIDGLLDLVENMNDEGEAKRIIRRLKRWGKIYDILIVTVLHVGKKDFNSIGHLGSATDRYCQSTLLIEKEKDGSITLNPKMLRSSGGFKPINCVYDYSKNVLITNTFL